MRYTNGGVRAMTDDDGKPVKSPNHPGEKRFKAQFDYYEQTPNELGELVDGKRHVATKFIWAKTLHGAREIFEAWREEKVASMTDTPPEVKVATVGALTEWYIAARATGEVGQGRKPAEKSTLSYYESMAKHLKQHGGGIWGLPLATITTDQADAWAQAMRKDGLSDVTANKALKFAKAVFTAGTKKGITDRNPLIAVEGFTHRTPSPNPLSVPIAHRLYEAINKEKDSNIGTAAALALFAGLRQEEVCGLRWLDLDNENGLMRIRFAIGRTGSGTNGETYLKETKNESSDRKVPVSKPLSALLKRHMQSAISDCMRAGIPFNPNNYILGDLNGNWWNPHELGREWRGVAQFLELKGIEGKRATFHDLRKTFASIVDDVTGHDQKTIHALLGHADTNVTQQSYIGKGLETLRNATDKTAEAICGYEPEQAQLMEFPATGAGA